jgi:FkbM family methyltransferase
LDFERSPIFQKVFMKHNFLANQTLKYIWLHPNCKDRKILAILRFLAWQAYKRITNRYLDINLVSNLKIRCYPDSYSAASVLYCGIYDYHEMNFLLRFLRAEDSFLDVGANIGIYTLLAASKIKSGSIYSFEPLPKNYTRLLENIELNQLNVVETFQMAISDFIGDTAFELVDADSRSYITQSPINKNITVATNTLDNVLANKKIDSLTLGKIDIEGAEILAFKGATLLFQKQLPPIWIIEINDTVNNFEHQKQDVVNLLQNYGYSLYKYDADICKLSPVEIPEKETKNVLAIADFALNWVKTRLELNNTSQT